MVIFVAFLALSLVRSVLATESAMCTGNHTLLQAPGDAVIAGEKFISKFFIKIKNFLLFISLLISAFIDTNDGPYCNESTTKGFEEISTALYVIQTLNKYDYVPGVSLGNLYLLIGLFFILFLTIYLI